MRERHFVLFLLIYFVCVIGCGCQQDNAPGDAYEAMWAKIKLLEGEQKYTAALEEAIKINTKAVAEQQQEQWARSLVRVVLLKRGLHSCEEAVRFLLEQKWPADSRQKALLHLFYANTLFDYYNNYSWEINQREKVSSKGVDLKQWTAHDIFDAMNQAYVDAYRYEKELSSLWVKNYPEYIQKGNYPQHIRATLKDFLVHQWANFLGNTNTWRPIELKEKYQIDVALLAANPESRQLETPEYFGKIGVHPAQRMVYLLDELYHHHKKAGNLEAALDTQVERIRKLSALFGKQEETRLLIQSLDGLLKPYEQMEWWAVGKYEYAILFQKLDLLTDAYREAQIGYLKYPGSIGGMQCKSLLDSLKVPHFEIKCMRIDRLQTPSVEIVHKNMDRLYLRAYKVDFWEWWNRRYRYPGSIDTNDLRDKIHQSSPQASWQEKLVDPGDYKLHKTYVTPKIQERGFYILAASHRSDFKTESNKIMGTFMIFSDLVTIVSQKEGGWEIFVVNGKTGTPIQGVKISVYRYDYNRGPQNVGELTTLRDGRVFFPYRDRLGSCFIVAQKGNDISYDPNGIYFSKSRPTLQHHGCFLYTDRSIYRPLQKLYLKVVTYSGNRESGQYACLPNRKAKITFNDPNGKEIETIETTTNEYGTASAEFTIPKGRILGQYALRCVVENSYGTTAVRVEEYKRPTFEVELKKPEKSLKLNENVAVSGEAKYYFGLPVTNGKIFYRVTRVPVWPWWYWWYYTPGNESRYSYEIAAGNVSLKKDGTFDISFVPKADPSLSKEKNISYNFKIDVEVTDEGGETRNASSSYPIGFLAVQADYQFQERYFLEKEEARVTITRTDLSYVPKEGEGQYRLVELSQPEGVLTPEKMPVSIPEGEKHIPGDLQRPRWEIDKPLQQYLYSFKDGKEVSSGAIRHGKDGKSELNLGKMKAGAYRLHYTTQDEWGGAYETQRDFIVAGESMKLSIPFFLLTRQNMLKAGEDAIFFYGTGIENQSYWVEFYQSGNLLKRNFIEGGKSQLLELPITDSHRGGFAIRIFGVHDYRLYTKTENLYVPWDNKHLKISFGKFRNQLRPGQKETWTVNVKGPDSEVAAAELLAYMYDRSLDIFVPHHYPNPNTILPSKASASSLRGNLTMAYFSHIFERDWYRYPSYVHLSQDHFTVFDSYPIGGLGRRSYNKGMYLEEETMQDGVAEKKMADSAPRPTAPPAPGMRAKALNGGKAAEAPEEKDKAEPQTVAPSTEKEPDVPVREKFHETAFFKPHLLTDRNGEATIEFEVPDSVTSWNVYVHAITKDLKFGTKKETVVTSKDMMVRPYMPRFFREGDEAVLKVVVNNATSRPLDGEVYLTILDPQTGEEKSADFGVTLKKQPWKAEGKESANVSWTLKAPHSLSTYAFKVIAKTPDYSDGELRPLPVLPSRIHLVQSKFITLKDDQTREIYLKDLEKAGEDPTMVQQSLIVTLDAQLIYSVLKALPYLVDYPYECVEQTLNRFLSTSIVHSLYSKYPTIEKMAKEFSKRQTMLDPWKKDDPNRKMSLEETPWLFEAEGGIKDMSRLINVLDPKIAKAQMDSSLEKLQQAQNGDGSFPWWPGGPGSPYMTLYLMYGFAKAQEFGVQVPKDMIRKAWAYLATHFRDYYANRMIKEEFGYHFITFLNYVLSGYRDASYYQGTFTDSERKEMLDYCFKHWKKLSPYLKGYLALTLVRMDRPDDARLVMESIMDSAKTAEDQGTFWAPEDRGWLWYNDNIESHAFVLRALQEVMPNDKKHIDGLVLWLLLNKKMNQWKSTRTTSEVVYSLVYTLHKQQALGVREMATVHIGERKQEFVFEPDRYTGDRNQIVVLGKEIVPQTMSHIRVEKKGPGYMFASATWHYSTEKLPDEGRGDFLSVARRYYLRKHEGQQYVLKPLEEGNRVAVGDQVEVHMSIRSKHPMEYVHLRDPRGAGFEPEKAVSGHRWDLGLYWYEEIRDSGTNFFFEYLPQGEYNFKYRIRAAMAGKFRVGPATLQGMYAPEFAAFSRGEMLTIHPNQ